MRQPEAVSDGEQGTAAAAVCDEAAAIASAGAVFSLRGGPPGPAANGTAGASSQAQARDDGGAASTATTSGWLEGLGFKPLGPACHLFARKFPLSIERQTFGMGMSCEKGLGLGPWCLRRRARRSGR